MTHQTGFSNASRVVIVLSALTITIAGLKAASSIVIPFLLSLFIAIIFSPIMNYFKKKKLPKLLALFLIIFIILFILFAFGGLLASSIKSFSNKIPEYETKINSLISSSTIVLENLGLDLSDLKLSEIINPIAILNFSSGLLSELGNILSNGLMVLFTVIFMLLESTSFPQKLRDIAKNKNYEPLALNNFTSSVKNYLWMKTIISFFTGAVITIALVVLGIDYPLLWGTLAFVLNFIPTVGSIIAAVPVIILAIIQSGPITALLVLLFYVVINTIIGNIIEPKYMGKGLGLSTLVVFLSLLFWGWVFGPIGMLLSVPLTMILKIALENSEDTKWLAVLLSSETQYE